MIFGDRLEIGGKGQSLVKMTELGFPIPKFVILTGKQIEEWKNQDELSENLEVILSIFDGPISIRSSPIVSMPGMMQTVLDSSLDLSNVVDSILKVLDSYDSKNAILYRKLKGIDVSKPAVILQRMVYGNSTQGLSGSGVYFSRDNFGKTPGIFEFKKGVMGEMVVSNQISYEEFDVLPEQYCVELQNYSEILENIQCDSVELEFTIENDRLWVLQYRKLSIPNLLSASYVLTDLYRRNGKDDSELQNSLLQIWKGKSLITVSQKSDPILVGIGVSPGVSFGEIGNTILYSETINNDLLTDLHRYSGVITKSGGLTAHISIMCRNLQIPYIICEIPSAMIGTKVILDGTSGKLYEYSEDLLQIIDETNYQRLLKYV